MNPLRKVLIVEDNLGDFVLLKELLNELHEAPDEILHVGTIAAAIEVLDHQKISAIFLDLGLPDSQGLESLEHICKGHRDAAPIIVVTGLDDAKTGIEAVERGAQDFLCKGEFGDLRLLRRSLYYAIERHHEMRVQHISKECLRRLANGESTKDLFTYLLNSIELLTPGIRTCFMRTHSEKRILQVVSGPNLPRSWLRMINGARVGENTLPFGRAVHGKERIMVYRLDASNVPSPKVLEVARRTDIKACWAEPIEVGDDVRGVMVFFLGENRKATSDEIRIMDSLREVAQAILKHESSLEKLDRSEARFRALYEQGADCVVIYDEKFRIHDANPACEILFGYSQGELQGASMGDLDPAGMLTGGKAILLQRLKNGETVRFEDHRCRKDGSVVPLQISASCVRYGDECLFMEICRDISEIRNKESSLLQLNRVLKALRDINQLITHEKSAKRLINAAVEILVNKRRFYHAWIVLLDAKGEVVDHAEASKYRQKNALGSVLAGGQLPMCMQNAGGKELFFCTSHPTERCAYCPVNRAGIDHGAYAMTLEQEGRRYGFLSIATEPNTAASLDEQEIFWEIGKDLSFALHTIALNQRKNEQEVKYRLLAENSADCIWMLSLDYLVQYINPAVRLILGYREEEVNGLRLLDFVSSQHYEAVRGEIESIVSASNRGEVKVFEADLVRKDGSLVSCELAVKVLFDGEGHASGLQGSMRDIDERKKAEKAILDAKADAESANTAKDEFLAVMSHEMRTPLNPIIGLSQLILEDCKDETLKDYVQSIYDAALRELELVNNILSYTKLDRGKVKPMISEFSLVDLCKRAVQDSQFCNKQLEIQFVNPAPGEQKALDATLHVRSAENLIHRVLMNLLGNGCKYTKQGYVRLNAQEISRQRDTVLVRFAVEDSGIGIDPAKLDRLFRPFEQVDSSLTREFEGAGLGLAICRKIVFALGGDIGVKSEVNRGSQFWFTLPLQMASVSEDKPKKPVSRIEVPDFLCKVLLVEDRDSNAIVAEAILKKYKVTTTRAIDGSRCVELCEKEAFDLILMDLAMPIMDGIEATQAIRRGKGLNSKTPVWAMTADVSDDRKALCQRVGMEGVIEKPLSRAKLEKALRSTLHSAAAVDSSLSKSMAVS
jgi:PAS domain S-box-containing protein